LPTYLDTLASGNHNLMIGFHGGVWVSSTFTILGGNGEGDNGGNGNITAPNTGEQSFIGNSMTTRSVGGLIIITTLAAIGFVAKRKISSI